jgi:hypothetical protein
MHRLTSVWPLVWERFTANWRLLAVLGFGVLVSATLLAASPIYTRVMNDLGLRHSLESGLGDATRNTVVRFDLALGSAESAALSAEIRETTAAKVGWLTLTEVRYGAASVLTLGSQGQPLPTDRLRPLAFLQTISGLEEKVRVVEGRLPVPTSAPGEIEVVLPARAAEYQGIRVGDALLAAHTVDDCNRPPPTDDPNELRDRARFPCLPQVFATLTVPMRVVGTVEQADPEDGFWGAGRAYFGRPVPENDQSGPIIHFLMPEASFYGALARLLPGVRSEFRLSAFADLERLNAANLDRARADLAALREHALALGGLADLQLLGALESFNVRSSFNQVSLLLLLLQVVGIAVYYVLLVSTMLADRRAEEIAMLRSRGGSVLQVVTMSLMEAGLLGVASAAVAPFVAAGVVSLLGRTPLFDEVSGGSFLPFQVVPLAFVLAAAGAALAVLAIAVPAFFAARRGMVVFLQAAARPGKPLLQRYYIDFGLAGLATLALWELGQQGSVYDPRSVGGWSANPLLMAAPFLLIMATGALMFRFLPLLLRLISGLLAGTAGPGLTMGLWQLTRSPSRYTQLALLVVMAAAVGTFAATYGETTDRSQTDRALFSAGVDVRTTGIGSLKGFDPGEAAARLAGVPGVERAATAFRGGLSPGPLPALDNPVSVLAVDPAAAPSLLWFREDFARDDLGSLFNRIAGSASGGVGLPLPGEPRAISLYANPVGVRESTTLWARTLDANGVFRLHEFGLLDFSGYRRLAAELRQTEGIVYPVSLVAILMTQPPGVTDAPRSTLLIDDIAVVDTSGEETVVDDFEGPFRWDVLRTPTRNRDLFTQVTQGQRRGSAAAAFSFRAGTSLAVRGVLPADPNLPAPAIASRAFLARTGARVGSEVEIAVGSLLMPVTISATASLFPSIGAPGEGFLILNQEHLYYFAGLTNATAFTGPNEAWLSLTQDLAGREAALREIGERFGILSAQVIDSRKLVEEVRSDPLVRAGGSGILFVALIASLVLLALGFALTLYVAAQARGVEVSVIRAVGFSPRQIFVMIALEYLVVAAVGLAIGTLAGLRIADTMLSFLDVTEDGRPLLPPFVLATQWRTVAIAFGAVSLSFLAGVVALGAYFLRLPVGRFLRITR